MRKITLEDLTNEQRNIVEAAADFYFNSSSQIFQFSGPAGTGKSVVMNAIFKRIGLEQHEIAPMSYVGAAAIVMRLKGLYNAKTIHSTIYEPVEVLDENNIDPNMNRPRKKIIFRKRKYLHGIKAIGIDEGSQVPENMKNDILSFGLKVFVCGDLNQLPPVKDAPAFLYTGKVFYLTEIMRQNRDNAIIYLSQRILNHQKLEPGWYGNVGVIYKKDLSPKMIERADVVLCGFNRTREKMNHFIRENLLGFHGQLPHYGERMICRKNNWQIAQDGINLANGLIGTVRNSPDLTGFEKGVYTMDFAPDLFNGVFRGLKCDYEYLHASPEEKQRIKNYKHRNEKFEYAYAITTHISQGSQYGQGIYIKEPFGSEAMNMHLDYTAITRFSKSCWFVLPERKYY